MSTQVILATLSGPLQFALPTRNSSAVIFGENSRTTGTFSVERNEPTAEGCYAGGIGGAQVCAGLFVQPFADGDSDSVFWMRLWGWHVTAATGNKVATWIPFLLAELVCSVGAYGGPVAPQNDLALAENERLCDGLGLLSGRADIYSPGRNLPAHALIPLRGAQKFQFDFSQRTPPAPQITTNALWARF